MTPFEYVTQDIATFGSALWAFITLQFCVNVITAIFNGIGKVVAIGWKGRRLNP